MHELLGPLLMTLVNSSFHAEEDQCSHPIAVLCSARDVEADSFLLFEIVMHRMKDMFAVSGSVKSLPGQPPIDYRYYAVYFHCSSIFSLFLSMKQSTCLGR
jgi:hypothetical protein